MSTTVESKIELLPEQDYHTPGSLLMFRVYSSPPWTRRPMLEWVAEVERSPCGKGWIYTRQSDRPREEQFRNWFEVPNDGTPLFLIEFGALLTRRTSECEIVTIAQHRPIFLIFVNGCPKLVTYPNYHCSSLCPWLKPGTKLR